MAFGLVLRIDDDINSKSVIVTTSLSLVAFTTVFNGSTVAFVLRLLFGNQTEDKDNSSI